MFKRIYDQPLSSSIEDLEKVIDEQRLWNSNRDRTHRNEADEPLNRLILQKDGKKLLQEVLRRLKLKDRWMKVLEKLHVQLPDIVDTEKELDEKSVNFLQLLESKTDSYIEKKTCQHGRWFYFYYTVPLLLEKEPDEDKLLSLFLN